MVWANSPWGASYDDLRALRDRAARRRALGRRRRAHAVLLRGRARAQARVRRRVAAAAGGRRRAGRRRGLRGGRAGADLPDRQRGCTRTAPGRLGDPGGHRHRVRAGRAGGGRVEPADGAAGVPAHPRGRRRPGRDRDHRRLLHLDACTCWPLGLAALGAFAAWAVLQRLRVRTPLVYLPLAVAAWWLRARERHPRDHRRRGPRPADPGPARRGRVGQPGRAARAPAVTAVVGGRRTVLRADVSRGRGDRRAATWSATRS